MGMPDDKFTFSQLLQSLDKKTLSKIDQLEPSQSNKPATQYELATKQQQLLLRLSSGGMRVHGLIVAAIQAQYTLNYDQMAVCLVNNNAVDDLPILNQLQIEYARERFGEKAAQKLQDALEKRQNQLPGCLPPPKRRNFLRWRE